MTETQTPLQIGDLLDPAPLTWGWFDCGRLATPAEFAPCVDCGAVSISKVTGQPIPAKMVGRRLDPRDPFVWEGPFCGRCDTARCIAEGCGDWDQS